MGGWERVNKDGGGERKAAATFYLKIVFLDSQTGIFAFNLHHYLRHT